ncbi:hypothetical protein [Ruania alba]|uniref:hypothetical protein n=1 Tax=Ruania alba TaxID=648782 RepID=UPI001114499C|nr:hypothetical protein [Ruania alba]
MTALTEENLTALEPFATEPICVSGRHPADIVPAGDQPTEGEGWRLLGDEHTGEVYRTGVATTLAQYEQLWDRAGMSGERPEVSFTDEIVVWFGAMYGSSCPIRLDGVAVTDGVLHGQIVVPGSPGACTDDANPHSYLVAVERAMLPAGPFHVQLSADHPPAGVPEERTVVDVGLREPGSTATDDQLGTDENLIDAADEPQPAGPGGVIEPGYPWPYRLELGTACGISRLGPLNGVTWVTDTRDLPAAWEAAREGETVVVEVLLTERTSAGGPSLTATVGADDVAYRPLRSGDPADC